MPAAAPGSGTTSAGRCSRSTWHRGSSAPRTRSGGGGRERVRKCHLPSSPSVPFPRGWGLGGHLLATLAVGVVDVVEAVLVDLAQPHVLPDAHQAVGVPSAVPPGEPNPPQLSPLGAGMGDSGGMWGQGQGEAQSVERGETRNAPPTPKTLVTGEEGGGDPLLVKMGTPGESMGPRGGLLYVGRQAGTG